MPRGGYRKHAGRKPKYPGYGDTVAIRVPTELAETIESAIAQGTLDPTEVGRKDYEEVQSELTRLLLSWRNRTDEEKKRELSRINKKMIQNLS